jgi:hypothetical protein
MGERAAVVAVVLRVRAEETMADWKTERRHGGKLVENCSHSPRLSVDVNQGVGEPVMKLPTWIPKVPRPWNPAWCEAWDIMSDNEKRWSFVVDMVILASFFLFIWVF